MKTVVLLSKNTSYLIQHIKSISTQKSKTSSLWDHLLRIMLLANFKVPLRQWLLVNCQPERRRLLLIKSKDKITLILLPEPSTTSLKKSKKSKQFSSMKLMMMTRSKQLLRIQRLAQLNQSEPWRVLRRNLCLLMLLEYQLRINWTSKPLEKAVWTCDLIIRYDL